MTNDEELRLLRDMVEETIQKCEDDNVNGWAEELQHRLDALDAAINEENTMTIKEKVRELSINELEISEDDCMSFEETMAACGLTDVLDAAIIGDDQ